MISRPHFTYIAANTPEQTQAREAAANEEWRKKTIFHPIVVQPSPPEPVSLPRPPPNPPIHGIGEAPIYNPPEPVVKRPIPEATTEEQTAANEESHLVAQPSQEPNPPKPVSLPRPPPTANPPIHGIGKAPTHNPPPVNPQNQEPVNPPPERVALEPLGRTLSIGIPQPTESPSPPQQTVAQESQSSKRLTTLLGRGLTDIQHTEGVSSPPPQQTGAANAASQKSQSSNPFGFFGSIVNGVSNTVKDVENAVTSGVTNAAKDVGNTVTGALSTANNAIQNAYASAYGTKPQYAGNPLQQFFNDIAEGSALAGYYGTETLGGAGEELAHVAQGKGLENFGQAVSQFNKAGGQNVAKAVGDVTEVALPAIATAVVAPELLPAELIGEASSVGLGEAISKVTTGKWQSLPEVLQEANEGGVLGAVGEAGGLALESGLAKGAGALTKVLSGSEDLASKVSGLTPVWRAAGGALTNTALQLPFTQNPEQLGIAAAIGGLAGGLGPGVAGKIASKIDELRGTGSVAELETLTSPLTGETTRAWKITLPNGDILHLVPKTSFGEGDVNSFIDRYVNEVGENNLLAHVTSFKPFLKDVESGIAEVVPKENASGAWAWRVPSKITDLYFSPGEGEHEAVALTGYTGLTDTEPRIPELRLGRSSARQVLDRLLHPFDQGGIILTRGDIEVGPTPPRDLVEYIAQLRAKYGGDNNAVIDELLNNPKYGPMYREFRNAVREFSASEGKPVIGTEDILGLSHERQVTLAPGAKLMGNGDVYNVWVRQTPELLENLPGPLRDILSDWSRLKVVGADIIPGEPTDLFNVNKNNEGERAPELRGEEGGEEGESGEAYERDITNEGPGVRDITDRIPQITDRITQVTDRVPQINLREPQLRDIQIPQIRDITYKIPQINYQQQDVTYQLPQWQDVLYNVPQPQYSSPVFSSASVVENENPVPFGPPPFTPAMAPGGFGGGGNREQEISGMAGEVIYL